jgi:hypothetical protein
VSTGDFQEALAALLGKDAPNLSMLNRRRYREDADLAIALIEKPSVILTMGVNALTGS